MFTLDEGNLGNYIQVYPIFKKYDVPFAFTYGKLNEVGAREFDIMKQFDFKTMTTTRRVMITQESAPQRLSRVMLCEL